jgi:IMP dehydrogenase
MAKISPKLSESLSEYIILTGWIETSPEEISLKTNLGGISLQYPFMTARMQCVVGKEMAVAAGRNGILTMIPRSLRDEDKQLIIDANKKARLTEGDIEFQDNPESVMPHETLEDVVRKVERTGHSVIPIMDRKSKLYGVYMHNPDNPPLVPPSTPITEVMLPLGNKEFGVHYLINNEDKNEIKEALSREEKKFLPILDENMILQKIAFLQKFNTNYIGIAISTRGNLEEEIEKWGNQVDTLVIDSSNACFKDAIKILKYAKQRFPEKPFGIGNIIQGRDFEIFAKEGADYIIGGMGVGSICKTGSERGNGRGQMTVAMELAQARDEYCKETGKYVPFVLDGGIANVKDMTVALAFADFIMMGNYFNRFYEAAAQKFESDKKPTSEENLMRYVESWGEGHPRARLVAMYGMNFRQVLSEKHPKELARVIERYGHSSISSATVEGVVGLVEYKGRLKPCVENDARYIRATISNAGAHDLASFREKAILEKVSARTILDMLPHDVEVREE